MPVTNQDARESSGLMSDEAPRLLVSRRLARAVGSRPCRASGSKWRDEELSKPNEAEAIRSLANEACSKLVFRVCMLAAGLKAQAIAQVLLSETYRRASRQRLNDDSEPSKPHEAEALRTLANEVCSKLVFRVCMLAAGLKAQAIAQVLLAETYRRASRPRWNDYDELVIQIHQHCSVVELGRSSACCTKLRAAGLLRPPLLRYWLRGQTELGQKDAMFAAIQRNATPLLRNLVAAGANVNCVFEQFWFRTPLHRAASRANRALCEQLVALRGNLAMRDSHGAAPIHLAASKGRLPILDMMLEVAPASYLAEDNSGRTACHMAALKGHLSAVRQLLSARASPTSQAHDGCTPMDMARRGQHVDVLRCLESWAQRERDERESLVAARFLLTRVLQRAEMTARALAPQATARDVGASNVRRGGNVLVAPPRTQY